MRAAPMTHRLGGGYPSPLVRTAMGVNPTAGLAQTGRPLRTFTVPMADLQIEREFPGLVSALAGDYTIVRELGRGGMGVVFLARDDRLDRPVALKVLPPALASDPTVRERFLREARTAAQLSHPNIVPVYSADGAAGWAYFAMAFIDG